MPTRRDTRDVTIRLRGDASGLNRTLSRMDQSLKRTASSMDRMSKQATALVTSFKGLGVAMAALETFDFARDMIRASDTVGTLTLQMEGLGGSFDAAYEAAQDLGVPLEDVGDQLNLLAPALSKLGLGFDDAVEFSGDLTNSLRLFGVEGAQANSIVTQLSQSLSSGNLSGDELKSLSENAAGLFPALEAAVQEILGSEEALKDLGAQGKVTSEVVYEAFQDVFGDIEDRFEELPETLEQQEARLGNAWTKLLDTLADKTKASEWYQFMTSGLTSAIEGLTRWLEGPDLASMSVEDAQTRIDVLERSIQVTQGLMDYSFGFAQTFMEWRIASYQQEIALLKQVTEGTLELNDMIVEGTQDIQDQADGVLKLTSEYDKWLQMTRDHVTSMSVLRKGLDSLALTTEEYNEQVKLLVDQLDEQFEKAYEASNGLNFYQGELRAVEDATKETNTALNEMGETIQRDVAGAFEDLFTGGIKSAEDFIKELGNILLGGVQRLAAQLLNQAIVVPIVGTAAGMVPGLSAAAPGATGGAAGAGSTMNLLSGVSSFFTGSSFSTSLAAGIAKGVGTVFGQMPAWFGSGIGNLALTPTLALGAGGVAGGFLGNALFGDRGYGSIGSGLGSAGGTIIGAMAGGPLGAILGGLLGGTGGGFLGSLFGAGTDPYARFAISEGTIVGAGGAKLDEELYNQAQAYIDYANERLTLFGDALGEEAQRARESYEVFSDKLDPDEIGAFLQNQTREILAVMIEAVPGAMGELVREVAEKVGTDIDTFGAGLEELQAYLISFGAAVNTLDPGSFESLEDIAERFTEIGLERSMELTGGLNSLAQVMLALRSDEEVLEDATGRVRDAFEEAGYVMPETTEALRDWVDGLDLTTEAGLEAAAMAGGLAEDLMMVVNAGDAAAITVQDYADAMLHVDRTLAATRQGIEEFGMTSMQVYGRRREAADQLMDALGEMTDPTQIMATVDQINELIGEGWAVLSEGQKRILQGQFLGYLDDVQDLAQKRLELGVAPLVEEGGEIDFSGTMASFAESMSQLDGSMQSSSEGMEASSEKQREAANTLLAAVRQFNETVQGLPSSLVVTVREAETI